MSRIIYQCYLIALASLTMQILQAPIEIAIGLTYGIIMGVVLWYFPDFNHVSLR